MSRSPLSAGVHHLRVQLAAQQRREESDEQLLHAFMQRRDEAAFAALVRRHGSMVLHVCRRVLGHQQDAEDVVQATFLVLARNAGSLRDKSALAGFLHGTAYRLALSAKRAAARRRKHEGQTSARPSVNPADELSWCEVRTLLDEEIARLPEKYRTPFVLVCVENVTQAEAARRLNLKEGTLSSRLTTARKRLARRLARRGVELTALLAAVTVGSPASALPSALLTTTTEMALVAARGELPVGLVSGNVMALAKSTATATLVSKITMATTVLLTATFLAGASAWTCRTLAIPQASEPQTEAPQVPPRPAAAKNPKAPPKEKDEEVTVSGRVLDGDGKPVKGARLSVPFSSAEPGITDAEGRFRVTVPRSVADPKKTGLLTRWNTFLVARAEGFGLAWTEIPREGAPGERTLRLVEDQPIQGRILNTEGKPLAGVRVSLLGLVSTPGERWDTFLAGWKQMGNSAGAFVHERESLTGDENFLWVKTDAEGRFQLHGIGRDRVAQLQVSGSGIAQGLLYVATRRGFDPAPINKALQERTSQQFRWRGSPSLLHNSTILYIADLGRTLEGVIREAGSGKPVAGMTVSVLVDYINYVRAVADANGRFRLNGLPKQPNYWLQTEPGGSGPWMGTAARLDDTEGLRTLKVELTVARGVVVTGRVIDRTTGKGVPSQVRSAPLPDNKFANKPGYDLYRHPAQNTPTDAEGRFRLVIVPGPSVLLVQASAVKRMSDGALLNPFTQAELTPDDSKRVSVRVDLTGNRLLKTANNKEEFLPHQNACVLLDLAENAGVVRRDVFVERGRTLTVHVEDADGKPLTGVQAGGLTDYDWNTFTLTEPSCTVYGLRAKTQRQLAFVHPQRHLAGVLTLRGDEKEAVSVRLKPTGTLHGRVVDADGQPLAGILVRTDIPLDNMAARSVDTQLRWKREPIRTGADGRFRIENVIPELGHHFILNRGKTYLTIHPPLKRPKVRSGQTLDLGDLHTKPGG